MRALKLILSSFMIFVTSSIADEESLKPESLPAYVNCLSAVEQMTNLEALSVSIHHEMNRPNKEMLVLPNSRGLWLFSDDMAQFSEVALSNSSQAVEIQIPDKNMEPMLLFQPTVTPSWMDISFHVYRYARHFKNPTTLSVYPEIQAAAVTQMKDEMRKRVPRIVETVGELQEKPPSTPFAEPFSNVSVGLTGPAVARFLTKLNQGLDAIDACSGTNFQPEDKDILRLVVTTEVTLMNTVDQTLGKLAKHFGSDWRQNTYQLVVREVEERIGASGKYSHSNFITEDANSISADLLERMVAIDAEVEDAKGRHKDKWQDRLTRDRIRTAETRLYGEGSFTRFIRSFTYIR